MPCADTAVDILVQLFNRGNRRADQELSSSRYRCHLYCHDQRAGPDHAAGRPRCQTRRACGARSAATDLLHLGLRPDGPRRCRLFVSFGLGKVRERSERSCLRFQARLRVFPRPGPAVCQVTRRRLGWSGRRHHWEGRRHDRRLRHDQQEQGPRERCASLCRPDAVLCLLRRGAAIDHCRQIRHQRRGRSHQERWRRQLLAIHLVRLCHSVHAHRVPRDVQGERCLDAARRRE